MKVLFLFPYPIGESPSQRFRFEQYFDILQQNGIQVSTQSFWSEEAWSILYKNGMFVRKSIGLYTGIGRRFTLLFRLKKYSFIFIHREVSPLGPPVFEWIIARILRKKVIYDFDDAIWLPNTSLENKIGSWFKFHGKVRSICRWSYRVSCGNEYLAAFARSFNPATTVNPTTIDTELLHNPNLYRINKAAPFIAVGWTGTHSTLPYVEPLLPIFESLSKKYSQLRLVVIADRKPDWNLSCLEFIRWNKQTEIADLMKIDIGIMPLTYDEWAKGKCGFKALQYMSLKMPALVSPVGINTQIVDHGVNGYYCATPDDWSKCLERLIQHRDTGAEMGEKGRQKVIDHYSVMSNTSNFLSLFE